MAGKVIDIRLGIQQRVLPAYRAAFFDLLASRCSAGLGVFAGAPGRSEAIRTAPALQDARYHPALNLHLGGVEKPYYVCWQSGLLRWLEAWQPQALIVEANPRLLSTRLAVSWMHARGRPVLGWGLGAPGSISPAPGAKPSSLISLRGLNRQNFFRQFDGLIAYSQRGAAEFRALGIPSGRVFVAYNAASPRPAQAPPVKPVEPGNRPQVLFVGRLQARKRLDHLLQACAMLPEQLQPDLIIVGDGPARELYEQQARRLYPRAHFAGAQYGERLNAYFQAADLFVLPGTGGLAVQQAMAHGLAVIVAQGDGTQDDLVRSENGWQIPPDDPLVLSQTLQLALSDLPRLRRMGQNSYHIVAQEINLETMVQAFVEAVQNIRAMPLKSAPGWR
jgi:glycosyltransferase involved in cell wall biosynthesis